MWYDIKNNKISKIEKLAGEYEIWMIGVLPYGKMKVKIYEAENRTFSGRTNIQIKRKFDGMPEAAVGFGKTIEETIEDVVEWFLKMQQEDYSEKQYPEGIPEEAIEYVDLQDF